MSDRKQHVYIRCQQFIQQRIQTIKRAMEEAQASANEETKSSAGDKYETGRAMMQLELEKNAVQLADASKLQQVLDQLNPDVRTDLVQVGSLVTTTQGTYYLSISAGKFTVQETDVFAVSAASPIGAKLMGMKKDDTFDFNGKTFLITAVE